MKNKINKTIKGLLFSNGLILTAGAMLGPIYAIFVNELGGDILDAGMTFGVFSFAAFLTTIFSGIYLDKNKNNHTVLTLGYILLAVGFLGYLFVNSIMALLLVQIIIGIGEAIYAPAFDGLFTKFLDTGKQNTEWGMWEGMDYLSKAMGAILGGIIAKFLGFDVLFIIMSLFCLWGAAYMLKHKTLCEE